MSIDATPDTMRSTYRQLTDEEKELISKIKLCGNQMAHWIHFARPKDIDRRYQFDQAILRAEEAVMWAVKAISG